MPIILIVNLLHNNNIKTIDKTLILNPFHQTGRFEILSSTLDMIGEKSISSVITSSESERLDLKTFLEQMNGLD